MKKQFLYTGLLGTLIISGISPMMIGTKVDPKAPGDAKQPTAIGEGWTYKTPANGEKTTSASYTFRVTDWGSKSGTNNGSFSEDDFDATTSTLTYNNSAENDLKAKTDLEADVSKVSNQTDTFMLNVTDIDTTITDYTNITASVVMADGSNNTSTFTYTLDDLSTTAYRPYVVMGNEWSSSKDGTEATLALSVSDWGAYATKTAYNEKDFNKSNSSLTYNNGDKNIKSADWAITSGSSSDLYVLTLSNITEDTIYDNLILNAEFAGDSFDYYIPDYKMSENSLSGGAIAGIVIGSLVVVGLIGFGIYYYINRNKA